MEQNTRFKLSTGLLLLSLTAFFASGHTSAQVFPTENETILSGIKEFDARVLIAAWKDVTVNNDNFLQNAQSNFELMLRRDGVVVDINSPNYLLCIIKATEDRGIIYSIHTM